MNEDLSFNQVKNIFTNQSFHISKEEATPRIGVRDLFLLPNQFAYSIDCKKAELTGVHGNIKSLNLATEDFQSIDLLYELVHPEDLPIFTQSIMQNFKYLSSKEAVSRPLRNSFSVSYRAQRIKGKRAVIKRDTFVSAGSKGVVFETIGIITILPYSKVIYTKPQMFGPDSEFFGKEHLMAFENILSGREIQLLDFISKGYSTRNCAESMFISIRTVETHRKNMLKKLEAKSTPHLVGICKDLGLI